MIGRKTKCFEIEKMEKRKKNVKINKSQGKGIKERGITIRNKLFPLENNSSLVLKCLVHITTCLEINAAYILCRLFKLEFFN